MALVPGNHQNERQSVPERREGSNHRQYDEKTILAVSALKYLGDLFRAKFNPPSHRKLVDEPFIASKILLQRSEQNGDLTFMPAPSNKGLLIKIKNLTQPDQNQVDYQRLVTAQLLRLAGYDEKKIVDNLAVMGTFEISKLLGKGVKMKIGSFFLELFKIDKKHALENKNKENDRRDTIGESAGVYPIRRKVTAPKEFVVGKSDPLEVGATHALRSLFTGALQYTKDLAWQGGNHPDADRDPGLNPKAIQTGANKLFTSLREKGFKHHLVIKTQFIEQFDQDLKASSEAKKCLDAPSLCLVDPNVEIIKDDQKAGEVRFHADSPALSEGVGALNKITICVFNAEHSKYRMVGLGHLGNLRPDQIVDLIKAEKEDYKSGWTNISDLSSDPIRPVFALSITENGKTPRGLIDNAGLNGETLVHYDFRVNKDGTVDCITHHGHTRQDGGNAAVYNKLQGTVLPEVVPEDRPMVMELATLYPVVEKPTNAHELLNKLGLSDIALGEGYNQQELKDHLKEINTWYNEAFSQQIFDIVSSELQDSQNIDTFIASLAAEHPQVMERQNLYSHKVNDGKIDIPPAVDELELLLDHLHTIKQNPQSEISKKIIKQTSSLIRNLLSPNISEVHLFDAVLAARGGVVNCTLPLFDYLRLETSMVKNRPYLNTILLAYQKITKVEEKKKFIARYPRIVGSLFADLEANLLDQTLARLGLPPTGYLLEKAGGAADQVELVSDLALPGISDISSKVYVQTSFLPGLVKFISALQADMKEENLAVSGTDDGKGNGYLFYRANLAKPESKDLFLNMLDFNGAIETYLASLVNPQVGRTGTVNTTIASDQIAFISRLKNTTSGNNTVKILNELANQELSDVQLTVIKGIMTCALQKDLHQTITKTQALAEMLALYAQQNITP
jgi:hypothetical protein